MKKLMTALVVLGVFAGGYCLSLAYDLGAANADSIVMTGSGSGSGSGVAAPHTQLRDPMIDPVGAVDDVQEAKKKGWLGAILVALYALSRVLGKIGEKVAWLAFLEKGRTAMIVAATGTILAACVDAALMGGSYTIVGVAALWALVGMLATGSKTA